MREFDYFLFKNFAPDELTQDIRDPRDLLGRETDTVISLVAGQPVGACSYQDCVDSFGEALVRRLIDVGILRRSGTALVLDCPVFLREDAAVLRRETAARAGALARLVEARAAELRACCAAIRNGSPVKLNLYHILCGMVFDGHFFDYLSGRGALATSRRHPSGLDYLNVLYEKCGALQAFSNGLLCSYNRLTNGQCALESFGDADGERSDPYRFLRWMAAGRVPAGLQDVEAAFRRLGGEIGDTLLSEAATLVRTGRCAPEAMSLLERFGYARNGRACVPVYTPEHEKSILEIESIVEESLGEAMAEALTDLAASNELTAVKHGADRLEIVNELYHLLFGSINEELVSRGIVAEPPYLPGEGRYLKCIEVYE